MIRSLTFEQQQQLAVYRDRWLSIGLSTEPSCRREAESAICGMYKQAKLVKPKIVWCGSPLSQGLTRAVILSSSVGDSVWASVRDSVWASVGDSVRASVWDSVRASGYGQHDAAWLAFYEYFREVCGLESQTEQLVPILTHAKNSGWFLPHKYICWVSERHHILNRDERGSLHCLSGPAVMYPDGWKIYAWHGVRVPEKVIEEQERITASDILKERNTEVRRVMRNLYGTERFMKDAGAEEVDRADEHGARLLALRVPGDPVDIRMMELTCPSTGSKYMERVPPDVASAIEGLSWRFRVGPEQYQPDVQT